MQRSVCLFLLLTLALLMPARGAVAAQTEQSEQTGSLIVLDLDDDGFDLLPPDRGIYWDIDNDGFAEATSWVRTGDALLAVDNNADNIVSPDETIESFIRLADFDTNNDGVIDHADAVWRKLVLWRDLNSNGECETGEVAPPVAENITVISLDAGTSDEDLGYGRSLARTHYLSEDRKGHLRKRDIAVIRPDYNDANTRAVDSTPIDTRVLFLPDMRGYGNIPGLRIAMSRDNRGDGNLLQQVRDLSALPLQALIETPEDYAARVDNILYRWAGVQDIRPDARGPNIDARKLQALEKLTASKWRQTGAGNRPDPLFWAALLVNQSYSFYFNHAYAALAVQSQAKALFKTPPVYNSLHDTYNGMSALDLQRMEDLATRISTMPKDDDKKEAWRSLVRVIDGSAGLKALQAQDIMALDAMIARTLPGLTLERVKFDIENVDIVRAPGQDYARRVLHLSAGDGSLVDIARLARAKTPAKQIVYSDIATDILRDCCKTKQDVLSYLHTLGFRVQEAPASAATHKAYGTQTPYTSAIQASLADKRSLLDKIRRKPFDAIMLVILMDGDHVQWAYAQLQRW